MRYEWNLKEFLSKKRAEDHSEEFSKKFLLRSFCSFCSFIMIIENIYRKPGKDPRLSLLRGFNYGKHNGMSISFHLRVRRLPPKRKPYLHERNLSTQRYSEEETEEQNSLPYKPTDTNAK